MESLCDGDEVLATPPINCGKRSYHQFALVGSQDLTQPAVMELSDAIQESSPPPQKRQRTEQVETVELIEDDDDDDNDEEMVTEAAKARKEEPDVIIVPDSQPDCDVDSPDEQSYVDASQDDDPEVPPEQTVAGAAKLPSPLQMVFPDSHKPYDKAAWAGVESPKTAVCPSDVDPLAWHKFKWTQRCGETLALLFQVKSELLAFLHAVLPLGEVHHLTEDTIPVGQQQAIVFPREDLLKLQNFVNSESDRSPYHQLLTGLGEDWQTLHCLLSCVLGACATSSSPTFTQQFGEEIDNLQSIITNSIDKRRGDVVASLPPEQKWFYLPIGAGFTLERYGRLVRDLQHCIGQCNQVFRCHFNPHLLIIKADCTYEDKIRGMQKITGHLSQFKRLSKKCLSLFSTLHWFRLNFVQLNGCVVCIPKLPLSC